MCCDALCCAVQVLLFNLLPPPGSPALQADVPGEAWEPPPFAVEVQAAVVNAIEQVGVCMTVCVLTTVGACMTEQRGAGASSQHTSKHQPSASKQARLTLGQPAESLRDRLWYCVC